MTAGSRPDIASSSATDGIAISPVSSTSSHPSSSSHSHHTGNLPAPPPANRQPAGKGKSAGPSGHQRFKVLGRKGKEKRQSVSAVEDDEDWTIAGISGGGSSVDKASHGHDVLISPPSPSRDDLTSRPMPTRHDNSAALFDSQLTELPAKEKKSKGRGLVKKTSRLFSRDKDKEAVVIPGTSASLAPGKADRQSSYSSNDSAVTSSSTTSGRPPSSARNGNGNKGGHLRRLSQDSQVSWHAAQGSVRSGVSSIREMSGEGRVAGNNNLSASVPALNRQALPQPGPGPSSRAAQETIPARMSSWITNFLPSSSGTGETAAASDPQPSSSPARKGPSAAANFLYAARQKAVDGMRQLLDSEAQPDRSPDTIWVMGVGHPGYRPSTPVDSPVSLAEELPTEGFFKRRGSSSSGKASPPIKSEQANLRPAVWPKKKDPGQTSSPPPKGFGNIFSTSTLSLAMPNAISSPSKEAELKMAPADSPSRGKRKEKEVIRWPEQFHEDFRSRVWCTYRSQYAPIISLPDRLLVPTPETYYSAFAPPADVALTATTSNDLPRPKPAASTSLPNRPSTSPWAWTRSGEERGLTSDAGWGCMLRTGQSMLANALIHLHLGRDWRAWPSESPDGKRREISAEDRGDYATYVRLLSWFLDDPSPLCPFSVHRMALIGRELGKEVGEWFGPSTAAGALKTLANSFSPGGLAVATATDSMIYKSDVYAASSLPCTGWFDDEAETTPTTTSASGSKRSSSERGRAWGDKAVLILIGLRLGLDGVNPIYFDSIKELFKFPQSVGIAGGRPSSSYYFVAAQANSLFYLDPHLTRPAVPLQTPPAPATRSRPQPRRPHVDTTALGVEESVVVESPTKKSSKPGQDKLDAIGTPTEQLSDDSDASSPTRRSRKTTARQQDPQLRTTPPGSPTRKAPETPTTPLAPSLSRESQFVPESPQPTPTATTRTRSRSTVGGQVEVDPSLEWYASAYSEAQLRTFHCEKVKKIPLSGLDPSMLLGFLCRDEAEFEDFCERASRLPQKIFTVQDEPPVWDEDDDAGLESVSEPDAEDEGRTTSASSPDADRADEDDVEVLDDDFSTTTQNAIEIETDEQRLAALKAPAVADAEADQASSHVEMEKESERPRPPKPRPLQSIGAIGSDTQSWIRPVSTGQEAPNGKSVL